MGPNVDNVDWEEYNRLLGLSDEEFENASLSWERLLASIDRKILKKLKEFILSKSCTIQIQRNETSKPITYTNVINAYTKGPMYCVLFEKEGVRKTHKYPLCSIFRVIEDYPESFR